MKPTVAVASGLLFHRRKTYCPSFSKCIHVNFVDCGSLLCQEASGVPVSKQEPSSSYHGSDITDDCPFLQLERISSQGAYIHINKRAELADHAVSEGNARSDADARWASRIASCVVEIRWRALISHLCSCGMCSTSLPAQDCFISDMSVKLQADEIESLCFIKKG